MLPDPLHPALVHFPIVLMLALPVVLGYGLWLIRRGTPARRAWIWPVVVATGLTVSAWLAAETGESQEERVEKVVPGGAIETHEEAAERFVLVSAGVLALTLSGLAGGRIGPAARKLSLAGALGLAVLGYRVGRSGGELVYRHGAAAAYAGPASDDRASGRAGAKDVRPKRNDERDDDD